VEKGAAGCKEKLFLLDFVMAAQASDFVLAFTMLATPQKRSHLASNKDFSNLRGTNN